MAVNARAEGPTVFTVVHVGAHDWPQDVPAITAPTTAPNTEASPVFIGPPRWTQRTMGQLRTRDHLLARRRGFAAERGCHRDSSLLFANERRQVVQEEFS